MEFLKYIFNFIEGLVVRKLHRIQVLQHTTLCCMNERF
jgi:hypothetical protein